jgi:hypothetical protein
LHLGKELISSRLVVFIDDINEKNGEEKTTDQAENMAEKPDKTDQPTKRSDL